jgi:UDP:flavonoid glycosyltransferase YjiC (YdhE family)
MTRILVSCLPYYSHLAPLLPVIRAARRAGHEVAVASAPAMAEGLARAGVAHLPLPHVLTLEQLLADPAFAASPGMPDADEDPAAAAAARARPGPLTLARAGVLAGTFARDLIAAARDWRPDVLVRENNEFGGYLAAEVLGLPRATVDVSPLNGLNLGFVQDELNGQRVALGLDPTDDVGAPNRGLLAGFAPRDWYPDDIPVRPDRVYRVEEPVEPFTAEVAAALADLPADRPLVVAGLGTVAAAVAPEVPAMIAAITAALGRLDCAGLLLGETRPAGPVPDNVRVLRFVPLAGLLGTAELFVSHGGFGGVAQALRSATPMIVLPLFGDQVPTAARIAELGQGRELAPTADADELALACADVLGDPRYRRRTAATARQLLACPGLDALAEDLAALV